MGISVTLDQTAVPKFDITITSPDSSAITAATLYRVIGGTSTPTRVQPVVGSASAYVEDPEADWGVAVAYQAALTYGSGSTATYTSAAQTITSNVAWGIHPTIPALSFMLDQLSFAAAGFSSITGATRSANRTLHDVIGSPYPVPTTTGTRKATAASITVTTVTAAEEAALKTLVNDSTPILIRVPAAWGWNWEDGYYDVGDLGWERPNPYGPVTSRTFTLPVQRVAAPAGDQQSSWSYPNLIVAYADYPSMIAAFADYPALIGDRPS